MLQMTGSRAAAAAVVGAGAAQSCEVMLSADLKVQEFTASQLAWLSSIVVM